MSQVSSDRAQGGVRAVARMALEISCSTRPCVGQTDCGDRCGWWATSSRIVMAVADGLGQGSKAAYAAEVALACIGAGLERPFEEIFAICHSRLRGTGGVALAVAVVDRDSGLATMASVGNIRMVQLAGNGEIHLRNTRGVVGGDYDQLIPQTKTFSPGHVLALFSDGLDDFFALRKTLESASPFSRDQARLVLDCLAHVDDAAAVLIYRHVG